MSSSKQPLLAARAGANLTVEEMALLVGIDVGQLMLLEQGDEYASPALVERYATVLGLSARELLAGEEPTAVALLFRRMSREGGPFAEAVEAGLAEALGGFVRTAREVGRLRVLLGEGPRAEQLGWIEQFKPRPLVPRRELYAQAAEMANSARRFVGLSDDDEIVSMRELVERLGILTMYVDPDQLDREIDGAALLSPQPAILVNLVGGGEKYWRTRMTLAHELCHLLFDRAELDPAHPRKFFIFSPKRRDRRQPSWQLFDRFDDLEARANAFAGEFLAPTSGVRKIVGALDPGSPEAVAGLISQYKIGRETAVNRLTNTFRLSEEQRRHMLVHTALEVRGLAEHPDAIRPGVQQRDQVLLDLTLRALAGGKIDAVEARSLLHLRLSDALPDHAALTPAQRAPLRSREDPVRGAAERFLYGRVGLEYFVQHIERAGDGWSARVVRREPDGSLVEVGALQLAADLTVSDESSLLAAIA